MSYTTVHEHPSSNLLPGVLTTIVFLFIGVNPAFGEPTNQTSGRTLRVTVHTQNLFTVSERAITLANPGDKAESVREALQKLADEYESWAEMPQNNPEVTDLKISVKEGKTYNKYRHQNGPEDSIEKFQSWVKRNGEPGRIHVLWVWELPSADQRVSFSDGDYREGSYPVAIVNGANKASTVLNILGLTENLMTGREALNATVMHEVGHILHADHEDGAKYLDLRKCSVMLLWYGTPFLNDHPDAPPKELIFEGSGNRFVRDNYSRGQDSPLPGVALRMTPHALETIASQVREYSSDGPSEPNRPPTAQMNLPNTVRVGKKFTLDARPSDDPDGRIRSYGWRIRPDGSNPGSGPDPIVKTGRTAEVALSKQGEYVVELGVLDDDKAADKVTRTLTVTDPTESPTARIDGPTEVPRGEGVIFKGGGSSDPDGTIKEYSWTVTKEGSGVVGNGHGGSFGQSFNEYGNYEVTLTVTDDDGATARATHRFRVNIDNRSPTARIEGPSKVPRGEGATFDGGDSFDPDGSIEKLSWRLVEEGGGTVKTGEGRLFGQTFTEYGNYDVTLTVTDNDGAEGTATKNLTVALEHSPNEPPTARIEGPSEVTRGQGATFDGGGSSDPDGSIEEYSWKLTREGDGTVARGDGRTYGQTFTEYGNYEIKLVVTDDDGATSSATKDFTVSLR